MIRRLNHFMYQTCKEHSVTFIDSSAVGLVSKWSTLDPKGFHAIPFQKLVFLISLYPEFLEKKPKEIKKSTFLVNFGVFVSSSMLI